jgi:acetylornithine deacetylase/succinyl-diaminopimelate desuccinylase family protein
MLHSEDVIKEVDRLAPTMIDVLCEVVRVESTNPKYPGQSYEALVGREGAVAALLGALFEEAGADVDLFAVEPGRENAVGVLHGSGGGRSLALNGHIDVVPGGDPDRWEHGLPFSGQVDGDLVFGRGTGDAKASLVAQAFAAKAIAAAQVELRGDLVLQAVVGEEVGDHRCGTTAVTERGYVTDAAVVGEPTSAGIAPVSPGLIWFSVTVTGKQAHSGLRGLTVHPTLEGSSLGVNAIDKGFLLYQELRRLEDEWAETKRHPLFPPGYFALLPGVVRGNPTGITVPFSLADIMTIEYCAYHDPRDSTETVKAEISERIAQAASHDPWLRDHPPAISWKLEWPATELGPDQPIERSLARAHKDAARGTDVDGNPHVDGFLGVCDTTWLGAAGVPAVVYGPGDFKVAHAPDEHVRIDEVILACRTYALLALEWCGVAGDTQSHPGGAPSA